MKLRDILPADAAIETQNADIEVGGVSADTRAIKRGDIFVAIAGGKADGLSFVAQRLPQVRSPWWRSVRRMCRCLRTRVS